MKEISLRHPPEVRGGTKWLRTSPPNFLCFMVQRSGRVAGMRVASTKKRSLLHHTAKLQHFGL